MRFLIEMREFNSLILGLEVLITLIVILVALLIYYKTQSIYKLSGHTGIKYFRRGFLFIGFGNILMLLNMIFGPRIFFSEFSTIKLFLGMSGLFSLIGISFLFSSMYSKYIKDYYIYILSLLVFFLGFFFHTRNFMMIYSTLLIIGLGIASFHKYKKLRKKYFSQIYIIYILIFITWLVSFLIRIFTEIPFIGRLINDVITGFVFMYILYLVIKKLK